MPTILFGAGVGTSITTVALATPMITTFATQAATLPQGISDTATVTGPVGGPTPTGTVTFTVFGPNDPTCAGAPVFTSTVPLTAGPAGGANDATATSGEFFPTAPGEYRWVAVYSGDPNFVGATSPCNAPNETSVVTQPVAIVNTIATESTTVGGTIGDTATVTGPAGSPQPTGTVTFILFDNPTCTGTPVFTSANRPLVNGQATSEPFTPPTTGTYYWVASYSGDALYAPATAQCGAPNEESDVLAAQPAITTLAQPTAMVGQPITDIATLTGAVNPTGTITFSLFGPNDATCAGPPVFTSVIPVNGNGQYTSAAFTPTQPGAYYWIAAYSGDANNAPVSGACGDPNEITQVFGPPTIRVDKTATPATLPEPGGEFTFNVVVTNTGPNALTITSLTDDVYGDITTRPGTCNTAIGTVLAADPDGAGPAAGGTYSCTFRAEFIGNAGDEETDTVTVIGIDERGQQATDEDDATVGITDVAPNIRVDKTATPETLPAPRGTFTFNVVVTNTSAEPVTITALTDDIYGNIATQGTCTNAVGTVLAANGGTYSCSFQGVFEGRGGDTQTDVVTVVGVDNDGTVVTDDDDATVRLTEVLAGALPTVLVDKTASPLTRVAPGGDFTFTVTVLNTSTEAVTIRTLTDDIYGNIATQGTCTTAVGTVLQPGQTYTCSFTGRFTGNAGDSQTDVVTAVVVDQDGNTATDSDDAVVRLVAPPAKVVPQQIVNRPVVNRPVTQGVLARTGSSSAMLATLAGTLLVGGGLLLVAARTMSRPSVAGAAGAARRRKV